MLDYAQLSGGGFTTLPLGINAGRRYNHAVLLRLPLCQRPFRRKFDKMPVLGDNLNGELSSPF
jgi:hypothetical protein